MAIYPVLIGLVLDLLIAAIGASLYSKLRFYSLRLIDCLKIITYCATVPVILSAILNFVNPMFNDGILVILLSLFFFFVTTKTNHGISWFLKRCCLKDNTFYYSSNSSSSVNSGKSIVVTADWPICVKYAANSSTFSTGETAASIAIAKLSPATTRNCG